MLPKMALAFLLGGAAVGTLVYVSVRKPEQPAPASERMAPVEQAPQVEPAAQVAKEVEVATNEPAPTPVRPAGVARAKRQMQASPAIVAKNEPAPAAPAPTPAGSGVPVFAPVATPVKTEAPRSEEPKPAPAPVESKPAPRQAHTVTIPAGTLVTVRLREGLSSEKNQLDEAFQATLDTPLIVDGFVIAERGSVQRGRIVELERSGRVKGRALLALQLNQLTTADGQKVDITTDTFRKEQESGVKGDVAKAGVAAGVGAVIGAIAGGGKGAAIGAGIGGAAGAGGAMITRGKPADLPSETRLSFRLKEPVTLTEKLN